MDNESKIITIKICLMINKLSPYYSRSVGNQMLYDKHLNFFCELFDEEVIFRSSYNNLEYPSTCDFVALAKNIEELKPNKTIKEIEESLKIFINNIIYDFKENLSVDILNEIDLLLLELLGIKDGEIYNNNNGYITLAKHYLIMNK